MPLTVLTDANVRDLLFSLNREDILEFQENLKEALHDYSTGTQDSSPCCSANQPSRIAVAGQNGQTTMFMPAGARSGTGIKIVSLTTPKETSLPDVESLHRPSLAESNSSYASSTSSVTTPRSNSSTSTPQTASTHRTNSTTSSMSNLSLHGGPPSPKLGATPSSPKLSPTPTKQSVNSSSSDKSKVSTKPHGALTLFDPSGLPTAFINAETLTAFRTALASTLLLTKRTRVHTITVFGAGLQAYWHIRLALILRGSEIHHVNIVNRTFSGTEWLMREIYTSPHWQDLRTANPKLRFGVLSRDFGEYARVLKDYVRDADVLICCTPSTEPLFPAAHVTSSEGRKKGRYMVLIGSYKPHMQEIDAEVLRQIVAPSHHRHHHKHADSEGVIVVDSLEACAREAGEVIRAGITPTQMVEVGELVMVRKAVLKEKEMGGEGQEVGLVRWLEAGNVLYKSVGLGIMDVQVGGDLVKLAQARGIGINVPDF
ncbi:hypothetical protein MMC25_005297 [Agyrium rufum]|nr:hypothetical protein [Agyrium rufum]